MAITVRKLDVGDTEITKTFDCGEPFLNEYLKRYAVKNQEPHMFGVTYVALSSDINDRILGYHTIANSSIPRAHLPEEVLKGLPKYSDIPAMLIGRFAVDITFAGRGVGHVLMSHALTTCVLVSQISAARYVIIEAFDSAVGWYQKYGFQEIAGSDQPNRRKMFLDLAVAKKAQEIGMETLFSESTSPR